MLYNAVEFVLKWVLITVEYLRYMLLLSQAARENVPHIFTSVAAVSVWTPAWRVMASSTVPTAQMRAWDALIVTAPVHQLLGVITSASAPQTERSVHNKCVSK